MLSTFGDWMGVAVVGILQLDCFNCFFFIIIKNSLVMFCL